MPPTLCKNIARQKCLKMGHLCAKVKLSQKNFKALFERLISSKKYCWTIKVFQPKKFSFFVRKFSVLVPKLNACDQKIKFCR